MFTVFATAFADCIFTVEPAGILILLVEVGTPPHQLADVFQSPDAPPTHWPVELTVTVTVFVICKVQPDIELLAKTLNVVVVDNKPVGKLMVPPVPATVLPILILPVLFRS